MSRKRSVASLAIALVVTLALVVGRRPLRAQEEREVTLKWLGTAGWELVIGQTVVLIDPYLSRTSPALSGITDLQALSASLSRLWEPDREAIRKYLTRADYICVGHSHWDHLGDVPFIAREFGAKVIGSETTCNILRSYGIPESQLTAVKGREELAFAGFQVRVVPSLHAFLGPSRQVPIPGTVSCCLKPPLKIGDFVEGGAFLYYFTVGDWHLLHQSSANFLEEEVKGLQPDVALIAIGGRSNVPKYTETLLQTLKPKIVIPHHYDNFLLPFSEGIKELPGPDTLEKFIEEVRSASPDIRVIRLSFFEIYRP
jgi:L-ascorbate metabolism protein UlaG (beta-lactamase superfamily)